MLELIVNNIDNKNPTCRTHCGLYDPFTKECGIFHSVNTDDTKVFRRCTEKLTFSDDIINDVYINDSEDEDILVHSFQGEKTIENSDYPYQPDSSHNRTDANWYISPDETFGCWIINDYPKKFMVHQSSPGNGKKRHIYKSPIPLHDHRSSDSLASKMCWYVDEGGTGQYMLLIKDRLISLY